MCRQIGLYEEESIIAGDLLSLFLSPNDLRSEKRGGNSIYEATAITSAIPDELYGLRSTLGYHDNDDGTQHAIVREPKLYRTPKNTDLDMRSTWIKIGPGWIHDEDGVEWNQNPHKRFKTWTEKAVFLFWKADEQKSYTAWTVMRDVSSTSDRRTRQEVITHQMVDETMRDIIITTKPLDGLCERCNHRPYWYCRGCKSQLCLGCYKRNSNCQCVHQGSTTSSEEHEDDTELEKHDRRTQRQRYRQCMDMINHAPRRQRLQEVERAEYSRLRPREVTRSRVTKIKNRRINQLERIEYVRGSTQAVSSQ